ncbi:putative autophagy-related protein 36 [Heracleum sosnowskyi]|uniref:Autophagy-related protein 36 n=1 Tax=Heracleum sosnowskyi TaxID=360622 RepID=A0AAD8MUA2_9APIA|nr:putative autophagy-related protein 36 [Heracleum sosnowskyi]
MPSNPPLISKISIKEEPDDPQSTTYKLPKTENSQSAAEGKVKIENETSSINCCGICLSEEGKSIRGYIDSCGHYFCFVCIMEWAEVESRCPLCKRRFSSISRQMKEGVFASEPIVSVPFRDQVYRHYEDVTTGNQASYAEFQCNVCHGNSNESLLLLCDLCDTASHTYCVGLGDTVPEDDWICRNCNILMYEHAEDDEDYHAEGPVSILDIVREPRSYNGERSLSNRSRSHSTQFYDEGISIAAANVERNSQEESHVGRPNSDNKLAARTVQCCRNVDSRVRALRENWDRIRQGSLSFSSFSTTKPGLCEASCGTSAYSSSCSNQHSHPKSSSSNVVRDHDTQDIKKAWKMMNAAMSIEKKKCNNVPYSPNGSKCPSSNMITPKDSASGRSMLLSSCHRGDKDQDSNKFKKRYQECAAEKSNDKRKYLKFQKENPRSVSYFEHFPATYSVESSKLSTSKKAQNSVQDKIDHEICVNLQANDSLKTTFSNNSSKYLKSSICRSGGPVAENHYAANQNVHVSSSCNGKEATNVGKYHVDSKARIDSDAKSEIQSLVKLNLKLLSKHKKLAVKKESGETSI